MARAARAAPVVETPLARPRLNTFSGFSNPETKKKAPSKKAAAAAAPKKKPASKKRKRTEEEDMAEDPEAYDSDSDNETDRRGGEDLEGLVVSEDQVDEIKGEHAMGGSKKNPYFIGVDSGNIVHGRRRRTPAVYIDLVPFDKIKLPGSDDEEADEDTSDLYYPSESSGSDLSSGSEYSGSEASEDSASEVDEVIDGRMVPAVSKKLPKKSARDE